MNLYSSNRHTIQQNSAVIIPSQHFIPAGPKIERREFEELLQRAMEILDAPKGASSPHA